MNLNGDVYIVVLNFLYKCGLTPYKFSPVATTGLYKIQTNRKHTFLCFLLLVLEQLMLINYIRIMVSTNGRGTAELNYFGIANAFGGWHIVTCLQVTLWLKSDAMVHLVNYRRTGQAWEDRRAEDLSLRKEKRAGLLLLLGLLIGNLIGVVLRLLENFKWRLTGTPSLVWYFVTWGREILFVDIFLTYDQLSAGAHYCLLVISILTFHVNFTLLASAATLTAAAAASLRSQLNELEAQLASVSTAEMGIELVKFQKLMWLQNEAFGLIWSGIVFGYMPLQVYYSPDLLQPKILFGYVEALSCTLIPVGFLIFSAWFTQKATSIFEKPLLSWQKNVVNGMCPDENCVKSSYATILHACGGHTFNLRTAKFIQFSSSFAVSVGSLLLTLSMVILEFQGKKKPAF